MPDVEHAGYAEGNTTRTLILGLGNLLLQDEGIGVHVVEHIQQHYRLPDEVRVLDGGTIGLGLLTYLEGVERLIVVDAVEAAQPPGSIVRLADNEIPTFFGRGISQHQVGLADLLAVARLRDITPHEVVLIGVQPASLEVGVTLSPVVAARLTEAVEMVLHELARWGVGVDDIQHNVPHPESPVSP